MAYIDTTQNIVLTTYGKARKEVAISDKNNPIQLMYLAVGDANGIENFNINEDQDYLINEVWRGRLISIQNLENENQGTVAITGYIPPEECGANYLKEYGIFDNENKLIFTGKLDNYYKPASYAENALPVVIQVLAVWGYNYGLSLYASNEYTYATKKDLEDLDKNEPTNRGALIYFMSAPGRRRSMTNAGILEASHIRIRNVNDEIDIQNISSGDHLLVHKAMTIRLPNLNNGNVHIKRMYQGGEDIIVTTEDTTNKKIDGKESFAISGYMDSFSLFCDGANWYLR